jgi:hypothetical protein
VDAVFVFVCGDVFCCASAGIVFAWPEGGEDDLLEAWFDGAFVEPGVYA